MRCRPGCRAVPAAASEAHVCSLSSLMALRVLVTSWNATVATPEGPDATATCTYDECQGLTAIPVPGAASDMQLGTEQKVNCAGRKWTCNAVIKDLLCMAGQARSSRSVLECTHCCPC